MTLTALVLTTPLFGIVTITAASAPTAEASTCPDKRYTHSYGPDGRYYTKVHFCHMETYRDKWNRNVATGRCICN